MAMPATAIDQTKQMDDLGASLNPSGIRALEYNVLIKPDEAEAEHRFDGGRIIKPQQTIDDEQIAATTGVVLDVSRSAFEFEERVEAVEPGDRVIFARYAGMKVKGLDGEEYLVLKDKSIAGVYEER